MTNKLQELFSHSIIYGLGSGFQSLIGFALLPLISTYFSAKEYGIYSLIFLVGTFSTAFFFFGASSALNRFYFEKDNIEYKKRSITTGLNLTFIGVFILIVLALIFSDYISILLSSTSFYSNHILLMLLGNSIGIILNYFLVVLRLLKKSWIFIFANILGGLVNLLIVYISLSFYNLGIFAPILGITGANFIALLICYFNLKNILIFKFELTYFYDFISFGIPNVFAGLAYYLLDWIDRFYINKHMSLSDVGIYSFGYKISMITYVLFIIPFALIWSTLRMQYSKSANFNKLTTDVISYYSLFGSLFFIFFSIFSKEIFVIFSSNNEFNGGFILIPWIVSAFIINGYGNIVDYGIYYKKKVYYYIILLLIACIINALLNDNLIPKFGYIASAYVTLITFIFYIVLLHFISIKYYYIKIDFLRILYLYILSFISVFLTYSLNFDGLFYYLLKILIFIFDLLIIYFFWFSKYERISISTFVKKKLNY